MTEVVSKNKPQKNRGKIKPSVLQVLEKHRATFEFEVNEDDVEGRWLRNGVEIQFSVEERFNYVTIRKLHRLTISETYRSDAGEYTFIAGKNRSTMHLRVNSKSRLLCLFPLLPLQHLLLPLLLFLCLLCLINSA